jgi:hypothetical protein
MSGGLWLVVEMGKLEKISMNQQPSANQMMQ